MRVSTDGNAIIESISRNLKEVWSDEKHGPELHDLIVKKAKSLGKLSEHDAMRLETLQDIRRENMKFAQSYEEFVREHDRKLELQNLIDLVDAYKSKYEALSHV